MQDRFKYKVKFETDGQVEIFDVIDIDFKFQQVFFRRQDDGVYNIGLGVKGAELIQCTGKKDKNNNLIFEGDILKETYFSEDTDSLTSCLYKVEFDKDVSAFCFTELDGGYKNYLCNFDYKPEDYEIIGNIYKTHELLNEVE